jgi:hypothetical protein
MFSYIDVFIFFLICSYPGVTIPVAIQDVCWFGRPLLRSLGEIAIWD